MIGAFFVLRAHPVFQSSPDPSERKPGSVDLQQPLQRFSAPPQVLSDKKNHSQVAARPHPAPAQHLKKRSSPAINDAPSLRAHLKSESSRETDSVHPPSVIADEGPSIEVPARLQP